MALVLQDAWLPLHPSLPLPSVPPPAPVLLTPFILPAGEVCLPWRPGAHAEPHTEWAPPGGSWMGAGPLSTQLPHTSPPRREGALPHFTDEQTEAQRKQCALGQRAQNSIVRISSLPAPAQIPPGARDGPVGCSICVFLLLPLPPAVLLSQTQVDAWPPHTRRVGGEGWGLPVTFCVAVGWVWLHERLC